MGDAALELGLLSARVSSSRLGTIMVRRAFTVDKTLTPLVAQALQLVALVLFLAHHPSTPCFLPTVTLAFWRHVRVGFHFHSSGSHPLSRKVTPRLEPLSRAVNQQSTFSCSSTQDPAGRLSFSQTGFSHHRICGLPRFNLFTPKSCFRPSCRTTLETG